MHFSNVAATFRIWSSGKKNPYLKYVSSHFLTLAIEKHMVRFGFGASFTFELEIDRYIGEYLGFTDISVLAKISASIGVDTTLFNYYKTLSKY